MTARPVTEADPAWFATVPLRMPDGSLNPEYGCVFVDVDYRGWTTYTFDSKGLRFCRGLMNGPTEGDLECQGRLFRIAGQQVRRVAA